MLAAGYRAFLGVPLYATRGRPAGHARRVLARRRASGATEEVEALVALAGNAAAVLANAELYQRVALEKERLDAILGNVADGIVAVDARRPDRALESGRGADHGRSADGGARPHAGARACSATSRVGQRNGRPARARSHRGGEQVWLSVSEAVMRDPAGGVAGRIFAFRDVSAERIVEQMKTDVRLDRVAGAAPPADVDLRLRRDAAARATSSSPRRTGARFLGYIASEAERLTSIVDQLLSVARLDAGDLAGRRSRRPTSRDVVEDVVGALARERGGQRPPLRLDLPDEPLDASVDREKLRQILDALVDNAVKYSPEGGTVTLAARRGATRSRCASPTRASGSPPDEHERIFSKFYRVDDSQRRRRHGPRALHRAGPRPRHGRAHLGRLGRRCAAPTFVFELPVARGRSRAEAGYRRPTRRV